MRAGLPLSIAMRTRAAILAPWVRVISHSRGQGAASVGTLPFFGTGRGASRPGPAANRRCQFPLISSCWQTCTSASSSRPRSNVFAYRLVMRINRNSSHTFIGPRVSSNDSTCALEFADRICIIPFPHFRKCRNGCGVHLFKCRVNPRPQCARGWYRFGRWCS